MQQKLNRASFSPKKSIADTPVKETQEGWAEAAKRIVLSGEDEALIPDVFEDEEFDDWVVGAVKEDLPK
jgi:hypothetical protein